MDGFAESEKSESETGFGFVKLNTAIISGHSCKEPEVVASVYIKNFSK